MAEKILKSITFPNLPDKYIIPEITVDAVPTQGSTNAVQSGGVKAAIEDMLKAFPTDTASGSIASFSDGADNLPLKSLVVNIDPVQAGSGDPSPENVRPITGWTGVKVTRTGKNLLSVNTIEDVSWAYDLITARTAEHNISKIINSLDVGTYTISYTVTITSVDTQKYTSTTAKAEMGGMTIIASNGDSFQNYRFEINLEQALNHYSITNDLTINVTANNKGKFTHCYIYGLGRNTATEGAPNGALGLGEYSNLQLELGSTATDYEPYQGDTYNITFPTEAGTVYGGQLNVTTGELIVNRAIWTGNTADMNNTEDYPGWQNAGIKDIVGSRINGGIYSAISNVSPAIISGHSAIAVNTSISSNTGVLWLTKQYFNKNQTEWKALALDVQIVLPLASPITYQLTPQEITSLLGQNNLWADTGDTKVEYRADTTLYIKRLADSDTDMVADANIVSGQYFMVGNDLYKATVNIASGASVIVGTNATKVSLAQALNEINA